MILTEKLLVDAGICEGGLTLARQGYIGLPFDTAISKLLDDGYAKEAIWLRAIKQTEVYLTAKGVFNRMSDIHVFNPFTGLHTVYPTRGLAEQAVLEISQQILDKFQVSVMQEIRNEEGDAAWSPLEVPIIVTPIIK